MAEDNVYEPGPSFVENDVPSERLTDMPAWLQAFAAQELERAEQAQAEAASEPDEVAEFSEPTSQSAGDTMLPDWLRDDSVGGADASTSFDSGFGGFEDFTGTSVTTTDSFISEDDLPDWLRAFSDEAASAPVARTSPAETMPAPRSVSTPAAIVRVPPVENVWLSTYERQALGPGPSLFALLASNTNGSTVYEAPTAQQNEPVRSAAPASPEPERSAGPAATPQSAEDAAPEVAPERNSTRLLLLTLLVVAALVLVSLLYFS